MRRHRKLNLILISQLCFVLLFHSGVSAAAQPELLYQQGARQTVLTAPSQVTVQPGSQVTLRAELTTSQGDPLEDEVIVLLTGGGLELYARTDASGVGVFHLSANLLQAGQTLWFGYPGNDGWNGATAVTAVDTLEWPLASMGAPIFTYDLGVLSGSDRQVNSRPVGPVGRTPDTAGGPPPAGQHPVTSNGRARVGANLAAFAVHSRHGLSHGGDNGDGDAAEAFVVRSKGTGEEILPAPVYQDAFMEKEVPTVLTVAPEITANAGGSVPIAARLTTAEGQPVGGGELVLFAGSELGLHARTDGNGIADFQLPPDLAEDDYELSIVFSGQPGLRAALADETLHLHRVAPSSAAMGIQLAAYRTLGGVVQFASDKAKSALTSAGSTSLRSTVAARTAEFVDSVTGLLPRGVAVRNTALWVLGLQGVLVLGAVLALGLGLRRTFLPRRREATGRAQVNRKTFWRTFPALPAPVWYVLRIASLGFALGLVIVLFVRPEMGLFVFWRAFIPLVPLVFFVAPGLWRNLCPMATLNQTPRLFKFTRAFTLPVWLQKYGYVVGCSLFLVLVSSRKVVFNQNGAALAILILCTLTAAFVMGSLYRGKSGWCSSICPLLPVQRIYGQTPFVNVTHQHCEPCLGCTKNCYDLSPRNAYLADLYDEDRTFSVMRRAFVGLFPGFVLAFYLLPNPPDIAIWQMYTLFALACAISMTTYFLVESTINVTSNKITVIYGALALNLYYWFNSVTLGSLISTPPPDVFVWGLRALVFGLSLFWIYRTYAKERTYIELTLEPMIKSDVAHGPTAGESDVAVFIPPSNPEVTVEPDGKRIVTEKNRTLLEIIESNGLPIESGCRMGLCGADPVCVLSGMDHLSKVGREEQTTLERLALAPNTRMACMARVRGDVKIALTPEKPAVYRSSIVAGFRHDRSVERVVIVGNGIAGVTAADHVRRRHPHCEIHLIGRERHHLYNRMGITRLIYGRSAMQGLYLLPDQWYDDFNITCWLNTHVTSIDRQAHRVTLGTGEDLSYDRLILAAGSQSYVPPIDGHGMPGTFVLRTAEDAMSIRAYVQENGSRNAVVAGGGLLGLEAAYGLCKLGLTVTVLERSDALLTRQLDSASAHFLRAYLEQIGIKVLLEVEAVAVAGAENGDGRVREVILNNGRRLQTDLLLVAAGIRSDVELARVAGLTTNQGVVVDAEMRTSDPDIYAAGDVAEFDGKVFGLWPVAVSQAEVAAATAVAEPGAVVATYEASPPVTMLKVAGIDLTSIGRFEAQSDKDVVIVFEESATHRYRKLVITDGKIAGAILLGYPQEAQGIAEAVKQQVDVTAQLGALRAGNWESLRNEE